MAAFFSCFFLQSRTFTLLGVSENGILMYNNHYQEVVFVEKNKTIDTEAMERALSPERLDSYIRVPGPGAWLVVVSLLVLAASVFVWGFLDTIPETLTLNGIVGEDGEIVCYIDIADFGRNIEGSPARVTALDGKSAEAKVAQVSQHPYSRPEIAAALGSDWLLEMVGVQSFAYRAVLSVEGGGFAPGEVAVVTLVTGEIKPISLIFD